MTTQFYAPAKRYDPVGTCIYCGATSYTPDNDDPLHDEHIIPYALSGELILPQSSCQACERVINPWETRLLPDPDNTPLRYARVLISPKGGLKSKLGPAKPWWLRPEG